MSVHKLKKKNSSSASFTRKEGFLHLLINSPHIFEISVEYTYRIVQKSLYIFKEALGTLNWARSTRVIRKVTRGQANETARNFRDI